MKTTDTKRIKLTLDGLATFYEYLREILQYEIDLGQRTFEDLVQFHYENICHRLFLKAADLKRKKGKTCTIVLNYAEVKTLSLIFQLLPPQGYMITLEHKILQGL